VLNEDRSAEIDRTLDAVLTERRLQTAFQPIVDLGSGDVVGFEGLIRGPAGSPLQSVDALLAAAYRADRIIELDWLARSSLCRAALESDLGSDVLLFLNVEPLALDSICPPDLWADIEQAFRTFPVVFEVTERSLERDPASLLDGLDRLRHRVAGFALDDVGSDPMTLSLLPLVAPTVIKLDLEVIQDHPSRHVTQVLDLAYEEAERTGATLMAEGIETAAHLATARSYGAILGQGFLLGEPGSLPPAMRPLRAFVPPQVRTPSTVSLPFDALRDGAIARASAPLLAALSERLEACAIEPPGILVTYFPSPQLFGASERARFSDFAQRGFITAELGPGIPSDPGGGIRGSVPGPNNELAGQWAAVFLSPGSAGAMLARPANDGSTDYEFAVTHNRQQVIAAARCLLRLVRPMAPPTAAEP
jgi:EAL domain-containing protein (putative c-di-GMP-specific phosphodiesterase class I)